MKQPIADFLLGGPGHDGYAYQADVYCVDCGQDIIETLYADDYELLLEEDSNSAPQPIFFGESPDYAQHCAECGEYLYGEESDENESEGESDEDQDEQVP